MLPIKPLATESTSINGILVDIRSLSRSEVVRLRALLNEDGDAEAFVISCSTGESVEEAAKWLDSVDNAEASLLVNTIWKLSGLAVAEGPKA